jgi:hypothetical protein
VPVAPPGELAAFPTAVRVRPMTRVGGKKLRRPWRDAVNGNVYEWDYQHGCVEAYDSGGRHLGEFDPETGRQLKPADAARRIEP